MKDDQKRRMRAWTGEGFIRASIRLESAEDLIYGLDHALMAKTFKRFDLFVGLPFTVIK